MMGPVAEWLLAIALWFSSCPCVVDVRTPAIFLQDGLTPAIRYQLRRIAHHRIQTAGPPLLAPPSVSLHTLTASSATEAASAGALDSLDFDTPAAANAGTPTVEKTLEGDSESGSGGDVTGPSAGGLREQQLLDIQRLPKEARTDYKAFWSKVLEALRQERGAGRVFEQTEEVQGDANTRKENSGDGRVLKGTAENVSSTAFPVPLRTGSSSFFYSVAERLPFVWPLVALFETWRFSCVRSTSKELYNELREVAYINKTMPSGSSILLLIGSLPVLRILDQMWNPGLDKPEGSNTHGTSVRSWERTLSGFLKEFLIVIVPQIIMLSVPSSCLLRVIAGMICFFFFFCAAGYLLQRREWRGLTFNPAGFCGQRRTSRCSRTGRMIFVDDYRAHTMMITCLAILNVDFLMFPREYTKTYSFGISLMDMGVGSCIFSGGFVSRHARGIRQPFIKSFVGLVRGLWPLILLGLARLYSLARLDYYVAPSEYGIYWNFYLSLAVVGLLATLTIDVLFPARLSLEVGLILACVYQIVLRVTGAGDWMMVAPRTDFFSSNREGLLGVLGFYFIYLIAVGLGHRIFRKDLKNSESNSRARDPGDEQTGSKEAALVSSVSFKSSTAAKEDCGPTCRSLCLLVALYGVAFTAAYHALEHFDSASIASRRMVNLAWILGVVSFNLFAIFLCCFVDAVMEGRRVTYLVSGINENQLPIFFLANILTGIVNLSMQCLLQPPVVGIFVVAIYSFVWTGIGYVLAVTRVKFSFKSGLWESYSEVSKLIKAIFRRRSHAN